MTLHLCTFIKENNNGGNSYCSFDRNHLWETNGHRSHDMAILTLDKELVLGPRAFPICLPFDKEQMLDKVRSKYLERSLF